MKSLMHFTKDSWLKMSQYDTNSGKFEHEEAAENGIQNFQEFKKMVVTESLELLKATPVFHKEFSNCILNC